MLLRFRARGLVSLADIHRPRPAELPVLAGIAVIRAGIAVLLEIALHHLHRAEGLQVGIAPIGMRRPLDRLLAALRRNPDRRGGVSLKAGPGGRHTTPGGGAGGGARPPAAA